MDRRAGLGAVVLLLAACTSAPAASTSSRSSASPVAAPPSATVAAPSASGSPTTGVQQGGSGWQATATSYGDRIGERFLFACPPDGVNWFVYGTDVYTSDSSVCTAAVHFGLITLESGGDVIIEILPGQDSYVGSNRNDITSQGYGDWPASFTFEGSPTAAATPAAPAATASAPATATAAPTGEYLTADALLICLPFERSRFAEIDAGGDATGVDVEIGQQIAAQLEREPQLVETLFEDLIGAIEARTCDLTIGGQFITQARLERIDMIPYREGTPHVIVQKGNPANIDELSDLCGRSFAVVGGTVYVDMVHGLGDFADEGLNAGCADHSAAPIDLREYDSQADAEQALADGDVDAYAGNDFVTIDRPDVYERTVALPLVRNGIGHLLGATGVDADVRAALRAIIDDGSYADILSRYGVPDVALTVRP